MQTFRNTMKYPSINDYNPKNLGPLVVTNWAFGHKLHTTHDELDTGIVQLAPKCANDLQLSPIPPFLSSWATGLVATHFADNNPGVPSWSELHYSILSRTPSLWMHQYTQYTTPCTGSADVQSVLEVLGAARCWARERFQLGSNTESSFILFDLEALHFISPS